LISRLARNLNIVVHRLVLIESALCLAIAPHTVPGLLDCLVY
jgi:hypothetical protein